MWLKKSETRSLLLVLLLALVASLPVYGGSAVVGSVAGSVNATVDGQAVLPNTTITSGDSLHVRDGVAVVAVGTSGSRMVFGHDTIASFLRESSDVTVALTQGNVSLFQPSTAQAISVKAGDILVEPSKGFRTLGEVAMLNGAVVVTTKEGLLRVTGNGSPVEVAKGKTITIAKKASAGAGQAGAAGGAAAGHAAGISTSTALSVASIGTGVTSSVLSGAAISRAGDAKTAAASATSVANTAATTAGAAATSSQAAQAAATAAGNAINTINEELNPGSPSPFNP